MKSNFGHLSCAAGVAGLIKTVLALEHGAIPPTVHYQAPNPAIDFASSPFYVTTRLQPWERNGTPRRAGVSSFGVGGTNAHLVVEEAPQRHAPSERRSHQLIVLSARIRSGARSGHPPAGVAPARRIRIWTWPMSPTPCTSDDERSVIAGRWWWRAMTMTRW